MIVGMIESCVTSFRLKIDIVNSTEPFSSQVKAFIVTLELGLYKGG
jgi:hypothetical protein